MGSKIPLKKKMPQSLVVLLHCKGGRTLSTRYSNELFAWKFPISFQGKLVLPPAETRTQKFLHNPFLQQLIQISDQYHLWKFPNVFHRQHLYFMILKCFSQNSSPHTFKSLNMKCGLVTFISFSYICHHTEKIIYIHNVFFQLMNK